jgi:protein gp37
MASGSSIEWTEATWNPVTGCTKVSQGCKHCYAERMAKRLHAMGSSRYVNEFQPTLHYDLVTLPKRWKRSKLIFVNSMSDLFHDAVPDSFIELLFETMRDCPQHTFQVLTKRSKRLRILGSSKLTWPSNVWMGVSVENDQVLDRIDDLVAIPAKVRFLSCEPLLGPLSGLPLKDIHWVIAGGESGPHCRAMFPEWVDSIKEQCETVNVPFFFKQWGGVRKKSTGRSLHGRTYDGMPEPNSRPSESGLHVLNC